MKIGRRYMSGGGQSSAVLSPLKVPFRLAGFKVDTIPAKKLSSILASQGIRCMKPVAIEYTTLSIKEKPRGAQRDVGIL